MLFCSSVLKTTIPRNLFSYFNFIFQNYHFLARRIISKMGRSRSRSLSRSRSRSRTPPRRSSYHSSELHSVRIGNDLPSDITENEVRDVFEQFGEIGDVFLPKERGSDRTRGFGFVRFVRKTDQDYG